MSLSMNSVNLTCRLGKDPELKYTATGVAVCNLWVAVDMGKDKEGTDREATWLSVVCFDKQGEAVAQYCKVGDEIGVSGRLQGRQWQDSDGKRQRELDVVAAAFGGITFLRKKGEGGGGGDAGDRKAAQYAEEAERSRGGTHPVATDGGEDPFGDQ